MDQNALPYHFLPPASVETCLKHSNLVRTIPSYRFVILMRYNTVFSQILYTN